MYVLHIVVRYAALRMLLFAMKMPSVSVNVLETHAEWVFRVWSIFCEFVFNSSAVVWCASVYVCFCCLFLRLWMCYLWFCVLFFSLSLTHSHILHLTVDVILGNLATQLTQNEWLLMKKVSHRFRFVQFVLPTHKSSSLIISMWISFATPFQMINYSKFSIQIQMNRFIDDRRDRFCSKHIDFFSIDSNTLKETSFRNVLPWFRLTEKKTQNSVIVYYDHLLNRIEKKSKNPNEMLAKWIFCNQLTAKRWSHSRIFQRISQYLMRVLKKWLLKCVCADVNALP